MKVSDILLEIKETSGSNDKRRILESHSENLLLQKVLKYGLDSFTPFNIVKVPSVKSRSIVGNEDYQWGLFFDVVDACASREITGNTAVAGILAVFRCVPNDEEVWMRKILKKHLSIGASVKTVNKVFPGLIPTFDVSLAQKFEEKRIAGRESVAIEPKLDGIRCFAIVENGDSRLFARSGKLISNFDSTIGVELAKLGDGCYDGELMGEDFVSLMRQAYRKDDLDTAGTFLALFDYLPLEEWKSGKTVMSCSDRYEKLLDSLCEEGIDLEVIQPVERDIVDANYGNIKELHDEYVAEGYEGAMIKYLDAPYRFGRGYEVMKLKAFHDVDLVIEALEEGTGKHLGKMGSVVVTFKGVKVRVGSGFSDDLRDSIWKNPDDFIGRMVEIRYQEVTQDGSLRFPTFVCFRNDR